MGKNKKTPEELETIELGNLGKIRFEKIKFDQVIDLKINDKNLIDTLNNITSYAYSCSGCSASTSGYCC